jgi:hypothetical protein
MAERTDAAELVRIIRDPLVECVHRGHVAIWHHDIGLVAGWGDSGGRILPRSAVKMVQALPLVESGAADAAGLSEVRLALACASHRGAAIHTDMVSEWLSELGLGESDLRCGPQMPSDEDAAHAMIRALGRRISGTITAPANTAGSSRCPGISAAGRNISRSTIRCRGPCERRFRTSVARTATNTRSTGVRHRISRCRWKDSRGHSPHSPPRRTPACVARRCAASPRR